MVIQCIFRLSRIQFSSSRRDVGDQPAKTLSCATPMLQYVWSWQGRTSLNIIEYDSCLIIYQVVVLEHREQRHEQWYVDQKQKTVASLTRSMTDDLPSMWKCSDRWISHYITINNHSHIPNCCWLSSSIINHDSSLIRIKRHETITHHQFIIIINLYQAGY